MVGRAASTVADGCRRMNCLTGATNELSPLRPDWTWTGHPHPEEVERMRRTHGTRGREVKLPGNARRRE